MFERGATPRARRTGLAQLGPVERFTAIYRYASAYVQRKILSLTIEVTRRCNARCDFCDHWREPKREEDVDPADVVRRFDPLVVVFCGGEPLLRRDIVELVARVAAVPGWRYRVLITNGWLLTPELALALERAGLHQLNVSLNWPDGRQSEERRLKGLWERIERHVPAISARGIDVNLNTMMMRSNVDELPRIARLAAGWGANVSYTLYSEHCNGNSSHQFRREDLGRLAAVVEELCALKRELGNITNNEFYLRKCVDFIGGEAIPGCPAGKTMIHVSPQGQVRPCADLPPVGDYRGFEPRRYPGAGCDLCWMACRGEVQAPVDLARVRELVGL
jgi:MoaA/NifB/PqqE/SkfB family radical SAM enzyme